jgi:hypothetical protein
MGGKLHQQEKLQDTRHSLLHAIDPLYFSLSAAWRRFAVVIKASYLS